MKLAVLMFHALYADAEQRAALRPDERPYAISNVDFDALLVGLKALNPTWVGNHRELERIAQDDSELAIMLTFDDGHASAVANALPILQRHGLTGVFFVTTQFISDRDDYCNAEQLRQLHEAGMEVQSHGKTHRFLNTLAAVDTQEELTTSKATLEHIIDGAVNSISFPGGRFSERDVELGRAAGYRYFHTSQFGHNEQVRDLYKRMAYRAGMSPQLVIDLVAGRRWPTLKHRGINGLKRLVRRVLGESGYQKVYEVLKAR